MKSRAQPLVLQPRNRSRVGATCLRTQACKEQRCGQSEAPCLRIQGTLLSPSCTAREGMRERGAD